MTTVNTSTINGFIVLPNDTIREQSSVIFTMNGFDTDADDDATVVPVPIDAPIGADGSISVALWPNPEGVRTTFYRVTFSMYNGVRPILIDAGLISVPASPGPHNLNNLLPIAPPQGATVDEYIAQLAAAVVSAEDAADRAEAAAANIPGPFASRADFVTWAGTNTSATGVIASDGTVKYVASSGATDISDLPGWEPFGVVTPLHWAENTTEAVTDMTAALQGAFTYLANPDNSNNPGNPGFPNRQFRGRELNLMGQRYLVSDVVNFNSAQGLYLANGSIIADATSPNWATAKAADADAAILTNKNGRIDNLKFDNIVIECNEVMNGIYFDRPVHGNIEDVYVWGCWNQTFGIKIDNAADPGGSFTSNFIARNYHVAGSIGGDPTAFNNELPTATGVLCHNGDVQFHGGETIRVQRGLVCTSACQISGGHFSSYQVSIPGGSNVTNGSTTVVPASVANLSVGDTLKFDSTASRFIITAISGSNVTIDDPYNGTTGAAEPTRFGKPDVIGVSAAPETFAPNIGSITDCYFDQSVLEVHPRGKTITGNHFRWVDTRTEYAIALKSVRVNDEVNGLLVASNYFDLRDGQAAMRRIGSFVTENELYAYEGNLARDDTDYLPSGLTTNEEWTPVISDGSNNATTSTVVARYQRTSQAIIATADITLSDISSLSGNIEIDGLPLPAANNPGIYPAVEISLAQNVSLASGEVITGHMVPGGSTIFLYRWGTSGTLRLTSSKLTNTSRFRLSITYPVA